MELSNRGQKLEAHKIFESLIDEDRCNQSAWNGYIDTLDGGQEKIAALEEFLTIFPQNIKAQKELASLRMQEKQSTPPPVSVAGGLKDATALPLSSAAPSQGVQ